ncbi:MAG: hypothetical protein ACPKM0_09720, partial [Pleomorphochaeta sp.]
MSNIFEVLLVMGCAWSISSITKTLLKKEKNLISICSILVIIVFLLTILDNLLRPSFIDLKTLMKIYSITRLSYFLVGPVLLWYLMSLVNKDFKITKKSLIHLLPFIFWFIYVSFDPNSLNPKIVYGAVVESDSPHILPIFNFSFFWDLSLNLSRVLYSLYMVFIIQKYKEVIKGEYSTIDNKNNLKWIKILIITYTLFFIINSILHIILNESNVFYQNYSAFIRSVPAVLFVFFFSLYSEVQPKLIKVNKEEIKIIESDNKKEEKYKKSGLSDDECKQIFSKICEKMESEKYYLDSELTLNLLSEKLGISRHKVSEAINKEAGVKFYKFINGYRLEAFIEAIKTDKYPNFTILAIS